MSRLPLGAQRLLAFLAVEDRPVPRLYVAGSLWGNMSEDHALANLRTALWRLGQQWSDSVPATRSTIALDPSVDVDLRRHRAWVDGLVAGHPASVEDDVRVDGELLVGWYDDWVVAERERLHQASMQALEAACDQLLAAGHFFAAVRAGLAAVARDPLRESAQRALIRAHLAQGNYAEALRCYHSFRAQLFDALSLEPSPLMQRLMQNLVEPRDARGRAETTVPDHPPPNRRASPAER